MYINSPRIAFGPLKPHATFVKGSCEVHTHAGVCCVLCVCVFFFLLLFFFLFANSFLNSFSFFLPPKQSANAAFCFPLLYIHFFWPLTPFFFPPFLCLFYYICPFFFVFSHSLYTSFHRSSLFFFFSLYIYDSVLLRTFFFFSLTLPPLFFLSTVAPLTLSRPISHVGTTVFFPPATLVRVSVCALHL